MSNIRTCVLVGLLCSYLGVLPAFITSYGRDHWPNTFKTESITWVENYEVLILLWFFGHLFLFILVLNLYQCFRREIG